MKYPKPITWVSCGLVMACFAYLCAVGYRTHRRAQTAALRSCLLSMIDTLSRKSEIFTNLAQADSQWVQLVGNDRQDLFNALARSGKLDCRQANLREGEYVDLWGNAILVSFKKEPLHVIKWRFLSSGPDGSFRTEDDISIESP